MIERQIEKKRARLAEIDIQVGCVEALCAKKTAGGLAGFQSMMVERRVALLEERAQIERFLTSDRLAQELARLKTVRREMGIQKKNAALLGGLLQEIEGGPKIVEAPRVPVEDAPPAPERVFPATGKIGVIHHVAILGRGFKPGATLRVDGMEMLRSVFVFSGRLEGSVPAGLPAGRHPIIVVNPDGKSGILPDAYLAFA
jgi:hypothetical protein